MRKLIVSEFLTLDGVMEAPEEWQPSYVSEDVAEEMLTSIGSWSIRLSWGAGSVLSTTGWRRRA